MTPDNDLFADQGPDFAPQPDRLEVVAGKVVATMNTPSATQKRFNTLMARIDAEQALSQALQKAADTHVPTHRQAVREMTQESQRLCKSMALLLDQHIQAPAQAKSLTPKQKQQAIHMVLTLCEQLMGTEDPEVQALWQRYAPVPDAEEQALHKAQLQELAASFVGGDFAQGREFDSPEDVLRAALEFEHKRRQAEAEKRDAKRAERKAKKAPSAKALAAEQKELDAQNALRTVFRQLASALHPDREPDAQARDRKTALMSEVNAAYERKDLSALLRIQLQEELVDATKAAVVSEAKLKAMADLLAQQVKVLEQDNLRIRMALQHEFGYFAHLRFNEAELLSTMQEERNALEDNLARMRKDMQCVQNTAQLRTWLKEQTRISKAKRQANEGMLDMDDVLHAMMGRG
jgi:hypothetical protein